MKLHLAGTGYGDFLNNVQPPLRTAVIGDKMTQKFVDEFNFMRVQAVEPAKTFFEYVRWGERERCFWRGAHWSPACLRSYPYMIDNIVLIITGTLHDRNVNDLIAKCHPLGMFDSVAMA
jgi:V-type H+-transporting ATPase subunit d